MPLKKSVDLEHFVDVFSKAGEHVHPSYLSPCDMMTRLALQAKIISYHYKIALVCLLEHESGSQATQLPRWHCLARF